MAIINKGQRIFLYMYLADTYTHVEYRTVDYRTKSGSDRLHVSRMFSLTLSNNIQK